MDRLIKIPVLIIVWAVAAVVIIIAIGFAYGILLGFTSPETFV